MLDLLPPAGTFTPPALDSDLLLFAGGSGITPVMSILKSALAAGRGRIVLVYANADERSVIFASAAARAARSGQPAARADALAGRAARAAGRGLAARLARPYASYEALSAGPTRTWRR